MTGSETDKCAVYYGKQIKKLYDALKASLELQLHYAKLLNQYDGCERRLDVFKSPEAWMKRLERMEKNASEKVNHKRAKLIHQMLDNQAKLVKKMKAAEKVNRRCQTEVPNSNTFMTFGGVPGLVRCENTAVYVATEREPGPEGLKGAMSVCERCKTKLIEIKGADYATFVKIEDNKGKRK